LRGRAGPVGPDRHARARAGRVAVEDIVADYELSDDGVRARCAARGEPNQVPMLAAYLAEQGTSAGAIIERTLAGVDAERLAGPDAAALRARLLEPQPRSVPNRNER
jgi:hypothetical protein